MKIILITILLLLPLTAIAEDEVVLPFDYFYGRWVEGHYYDGILKENDLGDYRTKSSYTYTNSYMRFNVDNTLNYLVFMNRNDTISIPYYNISFRPSANWQIGLADIWYLKWDDKGNLDELEGSGRGERNSIEKKFLKVKSFWQNKADLRIRESHAPYSYYIEPFYDKGEMSLETIIEWNTRVEREQTSVLGYNYSMSGEELNNKDIKNNYSILASNSTFKYGLLKNLNLKVYLELYRASSSANYNYQVLVNDTLILDRTVYDKENRYSYFTNIKLKYNYNKFYITGGFGSRIINWVDKLIEIQNPVTIDDIFVYSNQRKTDLYNYYNRYSIAFDYLSFGSFDPKVILADYNNRYRKMLFHNQFLFHFEGNKVDYQYDLSGSDYSYYSKINLRYGMFNRFEVWLNSTYANYNEISRFCNGAELKEYHETFSYAYGLKYRSYLFNRSENNWEQDSHADIYFGDMLEFGELYLSLMIRPKAYIQSGTDEINLFSFSDLVALNDSYVKVNMDCGLGAGTELGVAFYLEHNHINEAPYNLILTKRLIDHFQCYIQMTSGDFEWFNTDITEWYAGLKIFM